jgi:hypothetical protein
LLTVKIDEQRIILYVVVDGSAEAGEDEDDL